MQTKTLDAPADGSLLNAGPLLNTAPQLRPGATAEPTAAIGYCLVASADSRRRAQWLAAAADSGWTTLACGNADEARQALVRWVVSLAIIDLRGGNGRPVPGLSDVAQQVAAGRDALLAVCGADGDDAEEVWARQLGAWLYLPSVSPNNDLTDLCGQALQLATAGSAVVTAPRFSAAPPRPSRRGLKP